MLLAVWAVWFCASAAGENWWEEQFGPADVTAVSGNGGLTAGVNQYSRLSSCRWPSPGYYDQLRYLAVSRALPELGVAPWHGAMWALHAAGQTHWLIGPPWQIEHQGYGSAASAVITTNAVLPHLGVRTLQSLFVHPEHDLLVAHIKMLGPVQADSLYWFQNFSPCTRLIPECPLGDWALDAMNDFAAFAAPGGARLYQFRPAHPQEQDWQRAENLAASGALPAEWSVFGPGVWIGCATPNRVRAFQCGIDQAPDSARDAIDAGGLSGRLGAAGQCHCAYDLVPEPEGGSSTATVYIAFGEDRQRVDALLDYAGERGYDCLEREAEAYWRHWLEPAGLTLPDNALENTRRRALLTIAQAMDRQTGAVVRAPITQPPLALASARDGAWIGLALDMAGYHALAEEQTRFYAAVLRREDRRGMPRGSMPAACYTNHVPASPHVILDVTATAWMLSSFWKHAVLLERQARRAYLESVWEPVGIAADFLAQWKHGVKGEPLHSFDSEKLRDTRTVPDQFLVFMGLESAIRIAADLGKPVPGIWTARQRELETLVRFHLLEKSAPWPLEPETVYWLRDVVRQDHAMWRATVTFEGARVAVRDMAFPTSVFLDDAAGAPPFPDAAYAAMRFIAATARLYGGP